MSGGDRHAHECAAEEEGSVEIYEWEKPREFAKEEAIALGWAAVINRSLYLRTHSGR